MYEHKTKSLINTYLFIVGVNPGGYHMNEFRLTAPAKNSAHRGRNGKFIDCSLTHRTNSSTHTVGWRRHRRYVDDDTGWRGAEGACDDDADNNKCTLTMTDDT